MESLSELLERRARDDAGKPFCFFADSAISFGELQQRVRRLASGFAALGVRPGDRVAVMLANHPDHPMVFLALAELGATQIPVNIHLRALGLEYVLVHSEAHAVVADERFAPELQPVLTRTSVELLVWRGTCLLTRRAPLRSTISRRPAHPHRYRAQRIPVESSRSPTPPARPGRRRA